METVYIKKLKQEGTSDTFTTPAVGLKGPKGSNKSIPHPFGQEMASFLSIQEAIEAVHRAGYDAEFEGTIYPKPFQENTKGFHHHTLSSSKKAGSLEEILLSVVPELKSQLSDKAPGVVASATQALGEIAAEEAIVSVIRCFHHDDAQVRKSAAESLAKMGKTIVRPLKQCFADSQWLTRHTALLSTIEVANRDPDLLAELLPEVAPLLKDDNWLVRSQAANVFAEVARLTRKNRENQPN